LKEQEEKTTRKNQNRPVDEKYERYYLFLPLYFLPSFPLMAIDESAIGLSLKLML
jgi:hypothetical protein